MERWEKQLKDRGAFFDETDPGFQEFVSREHIDGRIPVAQLARGYSLSGSLIARWVKASLAKRGR